MQLASKSIPPLGSITMPKPWKSQLNCPGGRPKWYDMGRVPPNMVCLNTDGSLVNREASGEEQSEPMMGFWYQISSLIMGKALTIMRKLEIYYKASYYALCLGNTMFKFSVIQN